MNALIRLAVVFTVFAFSIAPAIADDQRPQVRMSTTYGDIVLELDREKAPKTVQNFLNYVQEGFYNGTFQKVPVLTPSYLKEFHSNLI